MIYRREFKLKFNDVITYRPRVRHLPDFKYCFGDVKSQISSIQVVRIKISFADSSRKNVKTALLLSIFQVNRYSLCCTSLIC